MQEITIKRGGCTYRCYLKDYGKGRGKGYRIFCPKVDAKCKPGTAPAIIKPDAGRVKSIKTFMFQVIENAGEQGDNMDDLVRTFKDYKPIDVYAAIEQLLKDGKIKQLTNGNFVSTAIKPKPKKSHKQIKADVLAVIKETKDYGISRVTIDQELPDYSYDEVTEALEQLKKEGKVSSPESGIWKAPYVPTRGPTLLKTDPAKAARLRKSADGMTKQIDAKRNPATAGQRVTARRSRIIANMAAEADYLEGIQFKLYALADLHAKGGIPASLENVNSAADIRRLMASSEFPGPALSHWGPQRITERQKELKAFAKMGITSKVRFDQAWDDLKALGKVEKTPAQLEAERIANIERELIGRKIPGYFPTPDKIAADMVYAAAIQPGDTILEPSAGKGNIADAIRAKHPNNPLDVLEWNGDLLEILKAKGYNIVGTDFLKHTKKYDRIIMNPPFEKGQDINHVQHAYELLKPGGHIISIMSEGTFGRQDKKAEGFSKWLYNLRGSDIKLPAQAFQASDRPTGVATRMVFIEKRK